MFAALGIILLAAGAILTFAVDRQADGIDLAAIGWILMGAGGISLLIAAARAVSWSASTHTDVRTERHVTDDGRHVVEDSRVA
jgi:hypothetical protein